MEIHFKKKDERAVLRLRESRGVPYLSFPALEETGLFHPSGGCEQRGFCDDEFFLHPGG